MAEQTPKWVYSFGGGHADGSAADKDRLGGKGAHLAEMSRIGLPVPPGFTIATDMCAAYYENGRKLPDALRPMVDEALVQMASYSGAHFGDVEHPLLVSVRSGARASMPGMMDTVLNLGLNDDTVEGMRHRDYPVFSVQYHPEAAPGPNDASYFFEEFANLIDQTR